MKVGNEDVLAEFFTTTTTPAGASSLAQSKQTRKQRCFDAFLVPDSVLSWSTPLAAVACGSAAAANPLPCAALTQRLQPTIYTQGVVFSVGIHFQPGQCVVEIS